MEKPEIQIAAGLGREILTESLFLTGPTAVGKTEVSVLVAGQIGAEIISVDSIQLYKGFDIASAKPHMAERNEIPHHLLDLADPHDKYDAARFVREANVIASELIARGRKVVFCGGTGLYYQALLYGVGESPASDPGLREELNSRTLEALTQELQTLDPGGSANVDLRNKRRVVRALEVKKLTGRSFQSFRSNWKIRSDGETPPIYCLTRSREDLYNRINSRVVEMFKKGLLEEAREASNAGLDFSGPAQSIIGYRQLQPFFRGEQTLEKSMETVQAATRQYAKRQMTWFKNQLSIKEITWGSDKSAKEIAFQIADLWQANRLNQPPKRGDGSD